METQITEGLKRGKLNPAKNHLEGKLQLACVRHGLAMGVLQARAAQSQQYKVFNMNTSGITSRLHISQ